MDPNQEQNLDMSNENVDDPEQEDGDRELSPNSKGLKARKERKAMLERHGVIPEYIKISEIYQVYTAFTQANLKNQILH